MPPAAPSPTAAGWAARRSSRATSSLMCRPRARFTSRSCASAPKRATSPSIPPSACTTSRSPNPTCTIRAATSNAWPMRSATNGGSAISPATCTSCRVSSVRFARASGRRRSPSTGVSASSPSGLASATGPSAPPSTSARPPSPAIWRNSRAVRSWPPPGRMNPQIRFGEDLMSRVSYVMMNPGGEAELTEAVRGAVNALIGEVADEAGIRAGRHPERELRRQPDHAPPVARHRSDRAGRCPIRARAVGRADACRARDIDLDINAGARVYVLPCVAGHVGADAAGVVLSEAPHRAEETVLIVDVGTNAEIVLGNRERLLAASSAHRPGLRGRADRGRPARGARRDRAGAHRPGHAGGQCQESSAATSGPTRRGSPKPPPPPASPASAARGSSRRWPRCTSPASCWRTAPSPAVPRRQHRAHRGGGADLPLSALPR